MIDEQLIEGTDKIFGEGLQFEEIGLFIVADGLQAAVEEVELYFCVFVFLIVAVLFLEDGFEESALGEFVGCGVF